MRGLFAAPSVAVLGVATFFALEPWDLPALVPYWALPAFPAVGYGLLLAALERGRLLAELRYLRGIMGAEG
jgi:ABC-type polysaccharide/polyol phosphate export permease